MPDSPFTELLIYPSPEMPTTTRPRFTRSPWRITFLKPGDPYDVDLQALGTTADQPAFRFTAEAPLGWHGHTVIVFATYELPDSPPDAPRFFWGGTGPGNTITRIPFIAWRRQVRLASTPLYVEACWTPQDGETLAIRGLEKDKRKQSMTDHAYPAQRLLTVMTGGHDSHPSMDAKGFWETYYDSYQQILTERSWAQETEIRLPWRYEVAERMLMATKTLKRLRDRYGIPWPPPPPPWRLAK